MMNGIATPTKKKKRVLEGFGHPIELGMMSTLTDRFLLNKYKKDLQEVLNDMCPGTVVTDGKSDSSCFRAHLSKAMMTDVTISTLRSLYGGSRVFDRGDHYLFECGLDNMDRATANNLSSRYDNLIQSSSVMLSDDSASADDEDNDNEGEDDRDTDTNPDTPTVKRNWLLICIVMAILASLLFADPLSPTEIPQ